MIGKITRGERAGGLLRYLFGPTRFEASPHTDPHLVAAWDGVDGIEPPAADNVVRFDVRQLTALLEAPLAYAERAPAKPVWHCSVRAAPTDRPLCDAEWADIAREVVSSVGLGPDGKRSGVRWAAVRHAPDHIHIVATLVREDGTPARLDFDKKALRSACMRVEERYGLRATAPADGTAGLGPSRAEMEKARRSGRSESVRETLRRHVRAAAAGAFTEVDFWRRLEAEGLLVRHRMSERNRGEITGYSVALLTAGSDQLSAERTSAGAPLFFSGGKLAPELSLPRLRALWDPHEPELGTLALTSGDRSRLWSGATAAVTAAIDKLRVVPLGNGPCAADEAKATADVLAAAARLLEGRCTGGMHGAASQYDRAAREPFSRATARTSTGQGLRMSAVMLAALHRATRLEAAEVSSLVAQLTQLVRAVAEMRDAQKRSAQARAAHRAAALLQIEQHLYANAARDAAGARCRPRELSDTTTNKQPGCPRQERRNRGISAGL